LTGVTPGEDLVRRNGCQGCGALGKGGKRKRAFNGPVEALDEHKGLLVDEGSGHRGKSYSGRGPRGRGLGPKRTDPRDLVRRRRGVQGSQGPRPDEGRRIPPRRSSTQSWRLCAEAALGTARGGGFGMTRTPPARTPLSGVHDRFRNRRPGPWTGRGRLSGHWKPYMGGDGAQPAAREMTRSGRSFGWAGEAQSL